jgi:hypothetical protein
MEEKMFIKPKDPIDKDLVKFSFLNLCVACIDVAQPSQDGRSAVPLPASPRLRS